MFPFLACREGEFSIASAEGDYFFCFEDVFIREVLYLCISNKALDLSRSDLDHSYVNFETGSVANESQITLSKVAIVCKYKYCLAASGRLDRTIRSPPRSRVPGGLMQA